MTKTPCSFLTKGRSYALEQAIGYNIDYEPTQMH